MPNTKTKSKRESHEKREPRRLLTEQEAAILGVPRDASPELIQAAAKGKLAQAKARRENEKRWRSLGRTPIE